MLSRFDYEMSQQIATHDYPFYALLAAAMRRADSDNAEKLIREFPEVWRELKARYHAPGGLLPGERFEP